MNLKLREILIIYLNIAGYRLDNYRSSFTLIKYTFYKNVRFNEIVREFPLKMQVSFNTRCSTFLHIYLKCRSYLECKTYVERRLRN